LIAEKESLYYFSWLVDRPKNFCCFVKNIVASTQVVPPQAFTTTTRKKMRQFLTFTQADT